MFFPNILGIFTQKTGKSHVTHVESLKNSEKSKTAISYQEVISQLDLMKIIVGHSVWDAIYLEGVEQLSLQRNSKKKVLTRKPCTGKPNKSQKTSRTKKK